jgi:hydrogenase expression/formation protein HypE
MNGEPIIRLEHGSGGKLSRDLVTEIIYSHFQSDAYPELTDAGFVGGDAGWAMTTDSYVVDPPLFPGGDIGRLAVFGTCNDLAVSGARPIALTVGFILEEGLPIGLVDRVVQSMAEAAQEAGVRIISGDTKVVPRGKGGGIYVNTSGLGMREFAGRLSPSSLRAGDAVIVSAPVGAHGIAVLAAREKLPVAGAIASDCAPLYPACRALFPLSSQLRFLRDATRGGVAAILNEGVDGAPVGVRIHESAIPLAPDVITAADLLGLDPLEIANEGVFVAVVAEEAAEQAVERLREVGVSADAAMIGEVTAETAGTVIMQTRIGGRRVVDYPRGLLLPRIC